MTTLADVRQRAESDAKAHEYTLNPDRDFLADLLQGLQMNEERYGYPSCPCRLASGTFELDRDIICPCDYRDADVEEYSACYCTLFVRKDVVNNKTSIPPVPERRPVEKQTLAYHTSAEMPEKLAETAGLVPHELAKRTRVRKLWYCQQCGYVCFREQPPPICPICKAKKEMFADVILQGDRQ